MNLHLYKHIYRHKHTHTQLHTHTSADVITNMQYREVKVTRRRKVRFVQKYYTGGKGAVGYIHIYFGIDMDVVKSFVKKDSQFSPHFPQNDMIGKCIR